MRCTKRSLIAITLLLTGLTACKKWEDHTAIGEQDLTKDLSQAVAENPDLSKFNEYVIKTGLDTLLKSSRTYTIWAPNNAALQALDPAIVNDVTRLRDFLKNHISNQSYFTRNAQAKVRVPMLNGKYINFLAPKFDDASITNADRFVKNGVLHVIDKNIPVLPGIWDFVTTTTSQYAQNQYIIGLNYNDFDPSLAIVDSISSTTGLPVYRPGTGIVVKNRFTERVYNIKSEANEYTYFVIQNAGFTTESDSLKIYYNTGVAAVTDSLAKWNTVKDLAVEGAYPATALAGLISRSGVPIPLNGAFLVESRKMSNGIVHIFSKVDVLTASKFRTITIQGEGPTGFSADRPGNTNYRVRYNPATTLDFVDLLVSGHGVTTFYSFYRLNEVPSIKYRVFAFGVNDFQTGAFTQNVIPKLFQPPSTYTTLATLAHPVPLFTAANAYNEVLLGEFTNTTYGTLEIQLTCTATNPIVMDYIRLVPVP